MQVLVDQNAGTRVSDLRLRGIPTLRGDVAAYVRLCEALNKTRLAIVNAWALFRYTLSLLQDLLKLFQTGRSHSAFPQPIAEQRMTAIRSPPSCAAGLQHPKFVTVMDPRSVKFCSFAVLICSVRADSATAQPT